MEVDVLGLIEDALTIPATSQRDETDRTEELAWNVGVAWTGELLRSADAKLLC
jgi:hypothetical protein